MQEKMLKIKSKLDERLVTKSKKQITIYKVGNYILSGLGFLLICLLAVRREYSIIASVFMFLLMVLCMIFYCALQIYLTKFLLMASFREDECKKREMFQNGKCYTVVPIVLNVDKEIVLTLAVQEPKSFQDVIVNENEYREIVEKMIQNNEISLTAQLIDNKICISIYYKGEIYYPEELKSGNLRWFEDNFKIVE